MKILISGGPVPANLDAVKIVTNKFKGGLMASLAKSLAQEGNDVTYLTYGTAPENLSPFATVISHSGFQDYAKKVRELSPSHDVVVLGAAVANLIPVNPWVGKFPSHDYKEGDIINIPFTIAPRIITQVKEVAPEAALFGFKLLSGVPHEELITAAYETLVSSRATAVFANDAQDLQTIHMVMKDRSVHSFPRTELPFYLMKFARNTHFKSEVGEIGATKQDELNQMMTLAKPYTEKKGWFEPSPEGYVFGAVAMRSSTGTMLVTSRGKQELASFSEISHVDYEAFTVTRVQKNKASLNAPLLWKILERNPKAKVVVHAHIPCDEQFGPVLPYAIPGTESDSVRELPEGTFQIHHHGVYLVLNEKGELL